MNLPGPSELSLNGSETSQDIMITNTAGHAEQQHTAGKDAIISVFDASQSRGVT